MKIMSQKTKVRNILVLILGFILITALLNGLSSCVNHGMPINGKANFHNVTITIPGSFTRDAMQSYEDFWIFECDDYRQIILMSRRDITEDWENSLDNFISDIQKQGGQAKRESFLQMEGATATYTKDDVFCQEIVFVYDGSFFAVALRGGTQEQFQALLDTICISAGE